MKMQAVLGRILAKERNRSKIINQEKKKTHQEG